MSPRKQEALCFLLCVLGGIVGLIVGLFIPIRSIGPIELDVLGRIFITSIFTLMGAVIPIILFGLSIVCLGFWSAVKESIQVLFSKEDA